MLQLEDLTWIDRNFSDEPDLAREHGWLGAPTEAAPRNDVVAIGELFERPHLVLRGDEPTRAKRKKSRPQPLEPEPPSAA